MLCAKLCYLLPFNHHQMLSYIKKILLSLTLLISSPLSFAYPMPNPFPPFQIAGNLYYVGTDAGYFDLKKKYDSLKNHTTNPFIDPVGYKNHIAQKEREFYAELQKQKATLPST